MPDELTSPRYFGPQGYDPLRVLVVPASDTHTYRVSPGALAMLYVKVGCEAGVMKQSTEFGALIEQGRMHDRARSTWFKRKRHSKTVRRYAP